MSASSAQPAFILAVPQLYPIILCMVAMHCFVTYLLMFCIVVPARKKAFSPEFMSTFVEEHEKHFQDQKEGLDMGGNPDQGSGWYGKRLDLKSWFELNNSVRAH